MTKTLGTADARRELHDLRVTEWCDLGLAAVAIGLSLIATEVAPRLALPLFLGGVSVLALAGRAFFRRWDLCERLLLDPDAYVIAEIHEQAEQVASLEHRAILARSIRAMLAAAAPYRRARVDLVSDQLAALADELEDETLRLDPLCAVRCRRLVTDAEQSPLLNSAVPGDGLRIAIRLIRSGFEARS
jgi:hypothetical protein